MRYAQVCADGVSQLEEAGVQEAQLDARLLLEHVCGTDRQFLLAHGETQITDRQCQEYKEVIQKRKCHIPLQHITGSQEFMGLEFQVNSDVLIPRQDTEVLVEEVLRFLHDGMRILDLCTGSGCILLSLLHYSNDCEGVGTDISVPALRLAQQNGERLNLQQREGRSFAEFLESDLFAKVEGFFDIIVSNPPYIESEVIETLMEEVRSHEPVLALDGGRDGLFFYRKIVEEAKYYLKRGGQLFLEIGYNQAQSVMELLKKAGFWEIMLVQDFAGNDRVVYGTWRD